MTIIKQIGIFLLITLAYTVLWISGITLGITIFGAEAPGSSASDGAVLGLMFAASALNTAVIMFAVANRAGAAARSQQPWWLKISASNSSCRKLR